ncbi:alpha-L-fucosidase [Zunongwangia endophytica]|uniref:alpha-L-fucosidase n=1 Tax=Zunongwangia endophytica TaxID=1808945 RepID=A0ABV8H5H6_9FLAO|nr:alpha-L-fucosidase [Zunongwangia endophytica]MDN3595422.1 alpha-L-fucosidase [Zunongwangia endophytica]
MIQNLNRIIAGLGIATMLFSCQEKQEVKAPEAIGPTPSKEQLAWHEMELNAFIHFTTNTFTGKEWGYGDESPEIFNPTDIDVDQWMETLQKAGFKGVILTAKHHDGFALFPSDYTDHDISNSPYKDGEGDLVKEVAQSARAHGLKFGIYLSPWDRNREDYGEKSYVEYYRNQLKEVFTNYGDIFEMWFDGANGGDGFYGGAKEERRIDKQNYYDWPTTLEMVEEIQPSVLFFSDAGPDLRWVGNERGEAGSTNWNIINPDTLYAGKPEISDLLQTGAKDGTKWIPAEVDVSIRPGWFYHKEEDSLVKSPQELFTTYMQSVGRGSTLLLNVPPDQRGQFHENDVASLLGMRKIIDSVFANNLAENAQISASNFRGDSEEYSAENLIDGDSETYWATDEDVIQSSVEIIFDTAKTVNFVLLQEYIELGQGVEKFNISTKENGEWKQIAEGTTIGYKRILKVPSVETTALKIEIEAAKANPLLANLEIY